MLKTDRPFPFSDAPTTGDPRSPASPSEVLPGLKPHSGPDFIRVVDTLSRAERFAFASRVKEAGGRLNVVVHPYYDADQYRQVEEPPGARQLVDDATSAIFAESASGVPALALVEEDRLRYFTSVAAPFASNVIAVVPTECWSPLPAGPGPKDLSRWTPLKDLLKEVDVRTAIVAGAFLAITSTGGYDGCVGATIDVLRQIVNVEISMHCRPHNRATLVQMNTPFFLNGLASSVMSGSFADVVVDDKNESQADSKNSDVNSLFMPPKVIGL